MNRVAGVSVPMLVAGIFLLTSPATAATARFDHQSLAHVNEESSLLSKPANLEVKRVALVDALRTLRDRAGVDIAFSPNLLPHRIVSCRCARVTVDEALTRMLEGTGFDYFEMPLQIVIRPPQPSLAPPEPRARLASFTISPTRPRALHPPGRSAPPRQDFVAGLVLNAGVGQPVQGALVFVPGTESSAITNEEGRFRIGGLQGTTVTLQVQVIGYRTASVTVRVGDEGVQIMLEQTAIQLDEIVVGALGIDRAGRALGYAVARTTTDQLTINRTPNFINALQGRLAGVNISSMGTGPQGSSKVRIRGQSSFGANNSPLVVVNGVPIDNTNFGVFGDTDERGANRMSDSGDGLAGINPDDIVDMTVLKGAAASALYGARAKDGVIMITTRNRAAGGGVRIEYSSTFTTESALDYRDFQMEYGQGRDGVRPHLADGVLRSPESGVWSFGERFQPGMTQVVFGREVPYEPQPNQVRDFYRAGFNASQAVTVSQGGDNGGVSVSLSNLTSQAIEPGSDYRRNTANIGFTQRLAGRLTLSGNVNYSNEDRKNPPNVAAQDFTTSVVLYTLANSMPLSVLRDGAFTEQDDETRWSLFANRTNPFFALSRFENNTRDRVYGNVTGRLQLTDWLFAQARIGQDYWSRSQDYNTPTGAAAAGPAPVGFVNGEFAQDEFTMREFNADFLFGMNRTRGAVGLDVNVGGNVMRRRSERSNVLVQDFYSRGTYTLGNGRLLTPEFSLSQRQVNSLYGSAEVSYLDLLFLTGTLRNDWFSTLSPDNRRVLYPSLSASFVFTDALGAPNWLSFGKVRAAYAEAGSDTDVPPFADNLFYAINANLFRDQPLGSIAGNVVPNPDLRPMRLSEWELGVELTLFDHLTLDVGYYSRMSSDQIMNQQISNASGFTTQRINVGKSRNRGVELFAGGAPLTRGRFAWNASVNTAYNTSEVLDLGPGIDQITVGENSYGSGNFHGELRQVVGQPLNQLYGWGWLRDDQGRQVFDPVSGRPLRSETQLAFGGALPKWTGGITNSFDYRAVSLSFLVDFKLGHKMISSTHMNAVRHGLDPITLQGREQGCIVGDGVLPDGSVNTICAPIQAFWETIRTHRTAEQSVFNAGSWQLRQITLGYDFTRHLPPGFGIQGLRVNVVANNVAVLKKWVPHIHPDQNGIFSDANMGLESTGLPVTRGLGLNVNVRF